MRLLVAGCGYVGARLAEDRARLGDTVYALRRSARPAPAGAQVFRADLTEAASLRGLPEVDAVVFAPTPDTRDDAGYARTYVAGAEALARTLARRQSPLRWVHVSSTSVFEVDDGSWVDAGTPIEAKGFRALRLRESEEVGRTLGIDTAVLRLGGIYGPGREGLLARVAEGRAIPTGRFTNRIHRDDAASAIGHLLDLVEPPPVSLGVDRCPARDLEVFSWLAERLGVRPPNLPESRPPGVAEEELARGKRCRSDGLVECGFEFRYPSYVEGYGALLAARPDAARE